MVTGQYVFYLQYFTDNNFGLYWQQSSIFCYKHTNATPLGKQNTPNKMAWPGLFTHVITNFSLELDTLWFPIFISASSCFIDL